MKLLRNVFYILLVIVVDSGCQKKGQGDLMDNVNPPANTVTDIDGNVYKTVKIGNQVWMAENLKVKHYQDGTAIPNVSESGAWRMLTTGAYCSYDNDAANGKIYGFLYNGYAVSDARKLAPKGWHIPTNDEWNILYTYLGGRREVGAKIQETGTTHWSVAIGNNETGFTGLPGGGATFGYTGMFSDLGSSAYWWSATQPATGNASYVSLYVKGYLDFYQGGKVYGLSVRCVKD